MNALKIKEIIAILQTLNQDAVLLIHSLPDTGVELNVDDLAPAKQVLDYGSGSYILTADDKNW